MIECLSGTGTFYGRGVYLPKANKGLQLKSRNPLFLLMVPEVGIEPTRGRPRGILSPVRLPISPLRHGVWLVTKKRVRCQARFGRRV